MTSAVPKHPMVKYGPFGRRNDNDMCWKLMEDVKIEWEDFTINLRKGLLSDMGSVPRFLWWLVPPTGPGNLAFLTHDKAYGINDRKIKDRNGQNMSREQADAMMYDLLIYGGMPKWRAFVAWRGVRRGGFLSWKKEKTKVVGTRQRRYGDG